MRTRTTVNDIQEAIVELKKQLKDKDWYLHNYTLLNNIEEYLDRARNEYPDTHDDGEQMYNYLAYDLKWEDREDELFPMEL